MFGCLGSGLLIIGKNGKTAVQIVSYYHPSNHQLHIMSNLIIQIRECVPICAELSSPYQENTPTNIFLLMCGDKLIVNCIMSCFDLVYTNYSLVQIIYINFDRPVERIFGHKNVKGLLSFFSANHGRRFTS